MMLKISPKKINYFVLFCLFLFASISTIQAFKYAQRHSHDFQWSPAKILLKGGDPYGVYMGARDIVVKFEIEELLNKEDYGFTLDEAQQDFNSASEFSEWIATQYSAMRNPSNNKDVVWIAQPPEKFKQAIFDPIIKVDIKAEKLFLVEVSRIGTLLTTNREKAHEFSDSIDRAYRKLKQNLTVFNEDVYENQEETIIFNQIPVYLHSLYVILLPYSALDFTNAKLAWSITNFLLAFLVFFTLSRISNISTNKKLSILFLFLMSTPFRVTMLAGQTSLLVMFLLYLPFVIPKKSSFLSQGIGFLKYSFAPPFLIHTFFRKDISGILLNTIFPILCFSCFIWLSEADPLTTAIAPFQVGALIMRMGEGDIMSVVDFFIKKDFFAFSLLFYGLPSLLCVLAVLPTVRSKCNITTLAIISVAALISFPHIIHDWVFLLPALFVALSKKSTINFFIGVIVFYFWFGLEIYTLLPKILVLIDSKLSSLFLAFTTTNILVVVNFIMGCILLALLISFLKQENKISTGP